MDKQHVEDCLIYSINEQEKTASVTGISDPVKKIFIPKFINYNSNKYIVVKISERAFSFKSIDEIRFPSDSQVRTIEKDAFYLSRIKSITIPSSLEDLKDGWCNELDSLVNIKIDPNNEHFKLYDDKFLLCKRSTLISSKINQNKTKEEIEDEMKIETEYKAKEKIEEFDVLAFCVRDIKKVTIPFFIKIIGPYSFSVCRELEEICFTEESALEIIDKNAFSGTSIKVFTIPTHLKKIGEFSFYSCRRLQKVEFSKDSELRIIDKNAFSSTKISSINIPSCLEKIGKASFAFCRKLKSIEIPENSELRTIEEGAFEGTPIESIYIPSNLIKLEKGWCDNTRKISKIKVNPNNRYFKSIEDKLILGKSSPESDNFDVLVFCIRRIKNITIPDFVKIIDSYAFSSCLINSILIPPHITHIKDNAFSFCKKFRRIEIPSNSELKIIDEKAFLCSSLKSITIPDHLTYIGDLAFYNCQKLQKVEFSSKSELRIIGNETFEYSSIESFSVPSHLEVIGKSSFQNCKKLHQIDIPINSELKTIGCFAFSNTSIENIFLPASLVELKEGWYNSTETIKNIKIDPNNKNFKLYEDKFVLCKKSTFIKCKSDDTKSTTEIKIEPDLESEEFDVLFFRIKNIKKITLPSFIKIIGPYAFSGCKKLEEIFIPKDSMLEIIDKYAFYDCEKLRRVEIQNDSRLQIIGNRAFSRASFERISLPSSLTKIGDSCFSNCRNLMFFDISENSKLNALNDSFFYSAIKSISIPPHVTQIDNMTFFHHKNLQIIEFNENSELKKIDKCIFNHIDNVIIMIPQTLRVALFQFDE